MCPLCKRAVADGAHRYRISVERTGEYRAPAINTKALVLLHVCEACALQAVAALDSEALAV